MGDIEARRLIRKLSESDLAMSEVVVRPDVQPPHASVCVFRFIEVLLTME